MAYSSELIITLRPRWWSLAVRMVPLTVMFGFFATIGWLTGDHGSLIFLVGPAVGVPLGLGLGQRFRVELHDDQLVVVNLRRTTIPWGQIQGVGPPTYGWWSAKPVTVYSDTAWVRVLALSGQWPFERGRVDGAYYHIGQWWLTHRGADWRPRLPQPGAPWPANRNPYASPPEA